MGRNLKDFYNNNPNHRVEFGNSRGSDGYRADTTGPEGGAFIENSKKTIIATPDSGNFDVRRKVTRNRDVKKQGARLAEVAVGNKPKLRGDK